MDIKSFIERSERGTAAAIARAVGVNPVMVSQWASGIKEIPVDRCTAIEVATSGGVMRWDLRPKDWHQHWPELTKRADAPKRATEHHAA